MYTLFSQNMSRHLYSWQIALLFVLSELVCMFWKTVDIFIHKRLPCEMNSIYDKTVGKVHVNSTVHVQLHYFEPWKSNYSKHVEQKTNWSTIDLTLVI